MHASLLASRKATFRGEESEVQIELHRRVEDSIEQSRSETLRNISRVRHTPVTLSEELPSGAADLIRRLLHPVCNLTLHFI